MNASSPSKLPQLQNLIKRDPTAYLDEFLLQVKHFETEFEIFEVKPTRLSDRFVELVTFLSHTIPCFHASVQSTTDSVIKSLLSLVDNRGSILHQDVRMKVVQALILLKRKGIIDFIALAKVSFNLFEIPDKSLRTYLTQFLINDVVNGNGGNGSEAVKRHLQSIMFGIVNEKVYAASKAIVVLTELYRRRVWVDEKTVNIIALGCRNEEVKVFTFAINFFLGIDNKMNDDDNAEKAKQLVEINYHSHSKKTKKRQRLVTKQTERQKKLRRQTKKDSVVPLFPAIQLINDPQALSEFLLQRMKSGVYSMDTRMLLLNFVSRLIGCHKLIVLSFYSYTMKYLTSSQKDVTLFLAYLAQATHDLIPPFDILPVIQTIAMNFITERCSDEVIAVGINSIRELISRCPGVLHESDIDVLVQDIVMYSKKMHKVVVSAAKGFTNLIRELFPALLQRRDRGKDHNIENKPLRYGETITATVNDILQKKRLFSDFSEENESSNSSLVENEDGAKTIDSSDSTISESIDGVVDEIEDSDSIDSEEEFDDDEIDEGENDEDLNVDSSHQKVTFEPSSPAMKMNCTDRNENKIYWKPVKSRVRTLTNDDLLLIKKLKNSPVSEPGGDDGSNSDSDSDSDSDNSLPQSYAVDPSSLRPTKRVRKDTKIERITKLLEGKKDSSSFEYGGHRGGLTNKEKERKKNFLMVRKGKREVYRKLLRSSHEIRYQKNHKRKVFGRDKRKKRRV